MGIFNSPFNSKRVRQIEDPTEPPTPFAVVGGWGPATDARAAHLDLDDPTASERQQRTAGAVALARMERERVAEREAAAAARLGNAPRGRDLTKSIFAR